MKYETYTKTTVEAIEGHLLTRENFFETAEELAGLECVLKVDITVKRETMSMEVLLSTRGGRNIFNVGDIIHLDRNGCPDKPYPIRTVGEWEVAK